MGFFQQVYGVVKQIPRGYVLSYGQVARLCNAPHSSRIVGYALHANPAPLVIPCHRVVFKDGSLATSFAFGGKDAQRCLLATEGVRFLSDGRVDMEACEWKVAESSLM